MPNLNRVRNGGFEQSTPPSIAPFWTGTGVTESGGTQLLGSNNGLLIFPGGSIRQLLLPLQIGEVYTFQAALSTTFATSGTIDIDITGNPTRSFQGLHIAKVPAYLFYEFDFTASDASPTLTITNNTDANLRIDVVSVKLA